MFEFFDYITGLVEMVINFVTNMFNSAVQFIQMMSNAYQFVQTTVSALPPFCMAGLYAIIGISLLTLFLGAFIDF